MTDIYEKLKARRPLIGGILALVFIVYIAALSIFVIYDQRGVAEWEAEQRAIETQQRPEDPPPN